MTAQREMGPVARAVVGLIRLYQAVPRRRAGSCRFVPTCSAYATTAVTDRGVVGGGWLALRRLGRCRPGGAFGYDPVPPAPDRASEASTSTAGRLSPAATLAEPTAEGDHVVREVA